MSRFVRYAETTIIPLARERLYGLTLIAIQPYRYTVARRGDPARSQDLCNGARVSKYIYNIFRAKRESIECNTTTTTTYDHGVHIMPLDIFYLFCVPKTLADCTGVIWRNKIYTQPSFRSQVLLTQKQEGVISTISIFLGIKYFGLDLCENTILSFKIKNQNFVW